MFDDDAYDLIGCSQEQHGGNVSEGNQWGVHSMVSTSLSQDCCIFDVFTILVTFHHLLVLIY